MYAASATGNSVKELKSRGVTIEDKRKAGECLSTQVLQKPWGQVLALVQRNRSKAVLRPGLVRTAVPEQFQAGGNSQDRL